MGQSSTMAGAVAGGLLAGLGITAMMLLSERDGRRPSELTLLGRAGARRLGFDPPGNDVPPDGREQLAVQGGHLLLSAAAGAAYAASMPRDAAVVPSAVGFGLAFYAAMHWLAGPLLGLKKPEWRSGTGAIGMHTAVHLLFGLLVALGARAAGRS